MPIKVTVELIPSGDENRKEKLGSFYIQNVSPVRAVPAVYTVTFISPTRDRLYGLTHHRAEGWLNLVKKAIASV